MAWLTHAYTLPPIVSRFLRFKHTCTHSAGSRILTFLLALWKCCYSSDYLSASHSLENFSKFDIYLKIGRFLMRISRRSSTFVHCSCIFDISPPITRYRPLCSTSIIAVRANVDGASRCWKGRIRGRSDWSVGNQWCGAGRRQELVEMRFLRH